jgi:hypothetical protein
MVWITNLVHLEFQKSLMESQGRVEILWWVPHAVTLVIIWSFVGSGSG